MIYITGDIHGNIDISKLNTKNFPEQKYMTKDDYVIICGDFGLVWSGSKEEKYWLKWLSDKPFTTLFVDGNHENYNLLKKYPVIKFHGGNAHQISESVYHLMSGQIFEIEGNRFFTMGGASSHDKIYRKKNISWWEDELPNDSEYKEAEYNLEKCNNKVDYIITHCAPDSIQDEIAYWYEHDKLTNFLESVHSTVDFKHWFCGHYHIDTDIGGNFTCLYDKIIGFAYRKLI